MMKIPMKTASVVGVTLLSSFFVYLTIPFLVLYLNNFSSLSSTEIGIIVGTIPVLSSALGFLGGRVSDKLGRFNCISAGLTLSAIGYFIYTVSNEFYVLVIASSIIGASRSLFDPALKSLLTLNSDSIGLDAAFRLRYVAICIGVICGPLVGVAIAQAGMLYVFYVTSAGLILSALVVYLGFQAFKVVEFVSDSETEGAGNIRVVAKNKPFILLCLTGCLVFTVFSVFEMVLPMSLSIELGSDKVKALFPALIVLNAVFAIILQIPANYLSRSLSQEKLSVLGAGFFAVAFLAFSEAGTHLYFIFVATFLFTIAEVLSLPANEILISKVVPVNDSATYFGFAEVRQLGFFIGPSLGGLALDVYSSQFLFIIALGISLFIGLLYLVSIQLTTKMDNKIEAPINV